MTPFVPLLPHPIISLGNIMTTSSSRMVIVLKEVLSLQAQKIARGTKKLHVVPQDRRRTVNPPTGENVVPCE